MIAARWRRAPKPSGLLRAVRDMINDRNWREGAILPSDAHVRFWAAAIVTATTEMRRFADRRLLAGSGMAAFGVRRTIADVQPGGTKV